LTALNEQERIFAADGGEGYKIECGKSGEPLITTMVPSEEEGLPNLYEFEMPPPFFKHFVGDPPKHINAYEVCDILVNSTGMYLTRLQLWRLHEEKLQLRKSHLDHWAATIDRTGTERPVDAIIAPPAPYAAVPHGANT
jgi:amidase